MARARNKRKPQPQPQWTPVAAPSCACGACADCRRQVLRERIARAYEVMFLDCDNARPDRADEVLSLTAA